MPFARRARTSMKQDWSARASRRAHGSTNDIEELDQCPVSRPYRKVSKAGRPPRPGLAWPCRTARCSPGRRTGHPPPRSGAEHPSGTDCWLGATPQRRGGWGCPAPSSPAPIEVCRDGGRSQPPPESADRRRHSTGRGPTASAPATCATGAVSGPTAISCPATPKVNRTRRTCHQHRHPALKTRPPTDGSNATP